MPVEKKDIVELRKLSQRFAYTSIQMHETIGKKAGFAGTDHKYLGFFLQKGEMTAGELAHKTGLTTGAVTGLIDRFEKKRLVKRHFVKEDRRKTIIIADTAKIAALLRPFYQDFQDNTDELLESFSRKELQTLEKYFNHAIKIMNDKIARLSSSKK